MSNKPTTQQVAEAVERFFYLIREVAKQFSNETAVDRQDYSLETLDFISAANAALLRAAKAKGENLREGYAKETMKNAIIDVRRGESKHDPTQIDVEANFLDFYNHLLGGLNKTGTAQMRAIAEGLWDDLKPEQDETEEDHNQRVVGDDRLSAIDDTLAVNTAGRTRLGVLLDLLWKRKQEYLPVPYRVDLDEALRMDCEKVEITLGDVICGVDPTKDDSYDAFEVSDIRRQIKHFSNRRYVDNSQMVKTIKHLVTTYAQKLSADITDLVSMRAAWRLTLLYLLSVESSDLQKLGYEAGTTIKDILIIPDLLHLCRLAEFDLSNAVKMKLIEAKTFLKRAKHSLGLQ